MAEIVQSPVNSSRDPIQVDMPEGEEKLASMVFKAYTEAKAFKKNYDKDWELWYRYYAGQHWQHPVAAWRSTPVVNFIFSTIETIIPIMTDNRPQIVVLPMEPSDTNISEVIQNIIKKIWVEQDTDLKLPMVIKNTLKYGTGFAKVWWNPLLAQGRGDVAISVVDPRHMYPSPGALDMEDAKYIVFAANVPLSNVERDYPHVKGKLVGGIWDEDLTISKTITSQGTSLGLESLGPTPTTDNTSQTWHKDTSGTQATAERKGLVTLVEMWHRDESDRVMVTIMANSKLLRHGPSPFKHNSFPFIKFVDYMVPGTFWGMGEIQQLHRLQDDINRRRGQIHDILRLTANPPFVVDADSGIHPKAMTNRPGTILYKNRGSDVRWLQPPILPAALFSLQELDKRDFDSISGVLDVTQGRRPVGVEAASAIIELQEAAQTRIRAKVRNMEAGLRRMGQQIIALVQQFYTEPRVIRLVEGRGTGQNFIAINSPGLTPEGKYAIINDVSVGQYDLEIGVGSTMPVSKTRQFAQMLQLRQAGVVDDRAVLEHSGLSTEEVEAILSRMKKLEQEVIQAQTGGGAPPPAPESEQQILEEQAVPPTEEELNELEEEMGNTQLGNVEGA